MKTLKTEEVDGRNFKNIEHARRSIGVFIDTIYNAERLHSALGYCPPIEFALALSHGATVAGLTNPQNGRCLRQVTLQPCELAAHL